MSAKWPESTRRALGPTTDLASTPGRRQSWCAFRAGSWSALSAATRLAVAVASVAVLAAAAVPAVALALPDGRAYEVVTPQNKNGIEVGPGIGSVNGNAVDWGSIGGCCGATSSAATLYQSTRTSTGWQTTSITPKPANPLVGLFAEQAPLWWSPDLSETIFMTPASYAAGDQRPPGPGSTNYDDLYEEGPSGAMSWLSQGPFPGAGTTPNNATFDAATPDGAHVAFSTPEQLTPDASGLASLNTPPEFLYERNVATGTTSLVNINTSDPTLTPVATSLTEAAVGTTPTTLNNPVGPAVSDSLSAAANGHTTTNLTADATGQFSTSLSNPAGPAVNAQLTAPAVGKTQTTLTANATGAISTALTAGAGPAVSTTLASAANAGDSTINVASAANLEPGEQITLGGGTSETATIQSIGAPAPMQFSSSFGSPGAGDGQFADPQGVAVDTSGGSSNGDVYVVDAGNFRVEKFSSSGTFLLAFGSQGSAAGQFTNNPSFIAVDNSSATSPGGDVYVGDPGDDTITKFDPSGNLVTGWASGGQLSGSGSFGSIDGISVDNSGNLLVINGGNQVFEFAQGDGSPVTNFPTTRGMNPNGLAVDPSGDLFKVNGDSSVEEVTSTGANGTQVTPSGTTELAIDPATGDLLQDMGGDVGLYTFSGFGNVTTSSTFGSPTLVSGTGVAGSVGTQVYVADAGTDVVDIFVPSTGGTPITLDAPLANSHSSGGSVTHAADSSIAVTSSSGFATGQQIMVGGETATVASVPDPTDIALSAPLGTAHAPGESVSYGGDTSITVSDSTGFSMGQMITIDTDGSQETATIASVPDMHTIDLTSGLAFNHSIGAPVVFGGTEIQVNDASEFAPGETITIDTSGSGVQETAVIASIIDSTHLDLTQPLTNSHSSGAPVTYPGDSSIAVGSTAGFADGQTITIDPGTAEQETATVASVTDATHLALNATLTNPHAAGATVAYGGDTSIAVGNSDHFATGQTITIDPGGGDQETATVASVPNGTTIVLMSGLANNHASGETVDYAGDTEITVNDTSELVQGETITIDMGGPQETAVIASVIDPTHLQLTEPLANDHNSGVAVTYPGDSSIKVASSSNFAPGQAITIDPGNAQQETDTILSVPDSSTIDLTGTVSNPHAAGATVQHANPDSSITVASTNGFATGQTITIDTGGPQETATISGVTDATHLALNAPLANDHASGAPVAYAAGHTLVSADGAILGNGNFLGEQYLAADQYGTTTNAISSDGSKVFFESPPTSPGLGGSPNLYMRDESNQTTTEIAGNAIYQGASLDGSQVFYTDGGLSDFHSTTLTAAANAGDTTITVASTSGFVNGESLTIDTGAGQETDAITTVTDATHLTLASGLANGHASGAAVYGSMSLSGGNGAQPTAISNDGSHVYFVSDAALTPNGPTPSEPNLYVVDTTNPDPSSAVTFIATLNQTDASALTAEPDIDRPAIPTPDGSALVFDATSNLTSQNTAASTTLADDAASGATSVTVSSASGFTAGQTIIIGSGGSSDTNAITGISGTTLTLLDPLSFSHSSGEPVTQQTPFEIYRYSTADGSLNCISCGSLNGALTGSASFGAAAGGTYEPAGQAVPMSMDGSKIFFDSPDPLTSNVHNNGVFPTGAFGSLALTENVFEWENGQVSLISNGNISTGAELGGTTPSGNDVFFTTRAQLVGQDTDGYDDIYDARVGGGFPAPSAPATAPCLSADSCRTSIAPTVFFPVPSSSTLIAPNVGAPSFTVSSISAKQRKSFAKSGKLTLTATASEAGKISAVASAKINGAEETIASASASLFATSGGKATLVLHLSKAARNALAKHHKLVVNIAVSYSASNQVNIATVTLTKGKSTKKTKRRAATVFRRSAKAGLRSPQALPAHRGQARGR